MRRYKGLKTCSIVMLIQTAPGKFMPTQVEDARHDHLSLETGDFNGDGVTDFAVSTFLRSGGEKPDLILWRNESQK